MPCDLLRCGTPIKGVLHQIVSGTGCGSPRYDVGSGGREMKRRLMCAGSAGLIAAGLVLAIAPAQAQSGRRIAETPLAAPAAPPGAPAAQARRGAPPAPPT